jgi:hypothetical protein
MKHSLERTSPKGRGQEFIGTCRLCGTPNLLMSAVFEDCPNPRGLTEDEALIEAIEGPEDVKRVDAVALALLHATCRYYGDPIPENPDLSLTRVLARAALDAIEQIGATQTKAPPIL